MSEPTRYDFDEYGGCYELSHGDYILHSDYEKEVSRLKAEVEAYRSASDEVAAAFLALPTPHNQVARVCEGIESLKAENERLRKMLYDLVEAYEEGQLDALLFVVRQSAKEGEQS